MAALIFAPRVAFSRLFLILKVHRTNDSHTQLTPGDLYVVKMAPVVYGIKFHKEKHVVLI